MNLVDLIKAGKIHTKISKEVYEYIKIGLSLNDISDYIENRIKEETKFNISNPLEKGIGFPCGIGVNNVVAHYRANYLEKDIFLKEGDVVKIDYGVQLNYGNIIDSAFTIGLNSKYNELIQLSKDVTNYAVSLCGPDVLLSDIGKQIEEYVLSKEILIDNKYKKVGIMREICGHNILPFRIHGGKAVPNIKIENYYMRMKENDVFAIEPFITINASGKSIFNDMAPISHYMISPQNSKTLSKNNDENNILDIIRKNFYTLPFSQKSLYSLNSSIEFDKGLKNLVDKKIVDAYPPIYAEENAIVCQHEHTIFIKPSGGFINLTKNDNY